MLVINSFIQNVTKEKKTDTHTLRWGKKKNGISSDLWKRQDLIFCHNANPTLATHSHVLSLEVGVFLYFVLFLPLPSYILSLNGHGEQAALGALCMALQKKLPGK